MKAIIYHNPRCSKSRGALELLQQNGVTAQVVEYLKTPPDRRTLEELLALLGIGPRELLRKGEEEYSALELDNPALGHAELIDAMLAHPKLIERPIVVVGDKAIIGRPPEKILELL
ncbi:MAG: arsenate reductase (glutaredoxin) [Gammaproteobacteria bacterium]|nr:arsenate reductase (glutaredoxin) [Gammaproteobacteria bacterium]